MRKVKLLDYSTKFYDCDKLLLTTDIIQSKPEVPIIHSFLFTNYIPDDRILGTAKLIFENLVLFAYCDFDDSVIIQNPKYSPNLGMICKNGDHIFFDGFSIGMNNLNFQKSEDYKKRFGGSVMNISPIMSMVNPGFDQPFILTDSFNSSNIERAKKIIIFTPNIIDADLFKQDLYPSEYLDKE